MKATVLASGSKGNTTIITTQNYNILIDAGITLENAKNRIKNFPNIDIIIITHSHIDHIKGLKSYVKKFQPIIYTQSPEIKTILEYDNIKDDKTIVLDNLAIKLFDLSHDVQCCGISIKEAEKELIYITDTGYLSQKIINQIKNKELYIIESNHDIEMLRTGPYPFCLKQRIMGDKGHLSNDKTCQYLKKILGPTTHTVILAHLSEQNNTKELAEKSIQKVIKENINLYIAEQEIALEPIEV